MNRREEVIAVCDEVVRRLWRRHGPALRERVATALVTKGVTMGILNHRDEAIAVYDEVVRRFGDATEPALREKVAKAIARKEELAH